MAREAKHIAPKPKVALVGDGQTEEIYFYDVKDTDRPPDLDIFPELPSKTGSYEGVLNTANRLVENYDRVYALIDMDQVINGSQENKYYKAKEAAEKKGVIVLENNPCFEFWLLLHFKRTTKSFTKCDEVSTELKKYIPGYNKSKKFQVAARLYANYKDNLKESAIPAAKSLEKGRPENNKYYPRAEVFDFFEWYLHPNRIDLLKKET